MCYLANLTYEVFNYLQQNVTLRFLDGSESFLDERYNVPYVQKEFCIYFFVYSSVLSDFLFLF